MHGDLLSAAGRASYPRRADAGAGPGRQCTGHVGFGTGWPVYGSVFVGTDVTAAVENSLSATRIDPFPEPAW